MDISLINLDRTPNRLAEFVRLNGHLPTIKRYAAVDGESLDSNALIANGLILSSALPTYTKGGLGSALSHVGLWGLAVEQGQSLTICEDDAILSRHFVQASDALIGTLPADWDVVLWAWNFDSYLHFDLLPGVSPCIVAFDQERMRAGVEAFQSQVPHARLYRLLRAFGCPCYSISPKGAELLRSHCLPLREMPVYFPGLNRELPNTGIDIMMNDAYPRLQAYVSFPPLAISKNEHEISTIVRRPG